MMATTVGDFLIDRLRAWGVERLYGYPGDGINGILGSIQEAGNKPEFIQVRHEETAALMACAHAKYTGQVGVCLATQGPGAIHLLNGLYDAKLDHQPVVAIVGQVGQMSLGGGQQQEVDLATLFQDVASAYVGVVTHPAQVRHAIDQAMRIAIARRTVTCLIIPQDVQTEEAVAEPPHEHGMLHSGVGYEPPVVLPKPEDLQRAADVLNAGERVAILAGAGALGAAAELGEVAGVLGAGIAKALLGKTAIPDDQPMVTGSTGWLGTTASNTMLARCDTLLMVGTTFPYTEFLPTEGQARGVQIDLDPNALSIRYPMEVNLTGDAAATLKALRPLLKPRPEAAWTREIRESIAAWWEESERRSFEPANPLNPQRVFWELSQQLPADCIIAADSGTSTVWYARNMRLRAGMQGSVSGRLATMGCAIPYALAAKFAFPDRVAIALAGDGAIQMSGLTELVSVAKYWQRWSDPRFVLLVLNNRDLGYVSWEQRAMAGNPRFEASQALPDVPYAAYAELLGLRGIRVDHPDQVADAWAAAFAADRPCLIEAFVDPNVPVLPPNPEATIVEKVRQSIAREPGAAALTQALNREGVPDA